jgi:hypothetical protein
VISESNFISCGQCDRGGRGNAADKCSCGCKVTDPRSPLGCFLGTPIVGEPKQPAKLTRSQKRYQNFLADDSGISFREYLQGLTFEARRAKASGPEGAI